MFPLLNAQPFILKSGLSRCHLTTGQKNTRYDSSIKENRIEKSISTFSENEIREWETPPVSKFNYLDLAALIRADKRDSLRAAVFL